MSSRRAATSRRRATTPSLRARSDPQGSEPASAGALVAAAALALALEPRKASRMDDIASALGTFGLAQPVQLAHDNVDPSRIALDRGIGAQLVRETITFLEPKRNLPALDIKYSVARADVHFARQSHEVR